ncbi:hypothetical protein Mapa_003310 [Marchantia paleacea]|nr:hypothetical protein Mapa_003310 [Marchantia paleacea]
MEIYIYGQQKNIFFAYRKRDLNPSVRIMIPLFYPTKLFRHADYDPVVIIIYRFLVVGLEFALCLFLIFYKTKAH